MNDVIAERSTTKDGLIPSGFRMRPRGPEDEPFLYKLLAEDKAAQLAAIGWGEAQWGVLVQLQYRGRKMTYESQFPDAEDSIFLGEDGAPVGRLLLDRNLDRWRIVDLAILTAHRGRGLGTRVIRQCQQQAAAAGAVLALQVVPFTPARRFYERLGFRAINEYATAVEMLWSESIPT